MDPFNPDIRISRTAAGYRISVPAQLPDGRQITLLQAPEPLRAGETRRELVLHLISRETAFSLPQEEVLHIDLVASPMIPNQLEAIDWIFLDEGGKRVGGGTVPILDSSDEK